MCVCVCVCVFINITIYYPVSYDFLPYVYSRASKCAYMRDVCKVRNTQFLHQHIDFKTNNTLCICYQHKNHTF